ncbi:hypothetical protein JVT61DRAFT_8163 [Boletus reticuloceps]|uniref:Protein SMG7 n=1 Tax=Boletus reticuloceps TaxID=495285 RepID=A0A8I2YX51_9AGAM|nr:hypothetical protein JVT61DRAFT_8163 [Boletus reticuloceps]
MSDSASHLAREAKGLHQGLKELLKTHNPWDKEVEFSRKNLRRQYLRLLLVEPYATESKDAETHLWMQTSYQFISHYKQSLATLERTLQSAPRHQPRQGGHGPVEYRRLIQRFRQFLSDEEKFWMQFVSRYQRSFALHQARFVLVALSVLTPSDDANLPSLPDSGVSNGVSNQTHARNHILFPPEESTPVPDPAEHESRLAILSKAIVCLGDIARYRELYNEAGGRPKAGREDGAAPTKRGGRRRGGIPGFDSIPRARNYDKAIQCYEQARLLVPYEGNSSHQLAILAFYQGDMFSSLFHYYRALCVRQPYDTASENVKKILNKALDQQIKKTRDVPQTTVTESGEVPPRLRVDYFKENIVLLHALWRLGSDKIKMNPVAHANDVSEDFQSLVSDRILPIETVSKVVVLSQGALWKHRMIRDNSPPSNRRSSGLPDSSIIESHILTHVLAIHRVLLEIGAAELAAPPEDAAENDLAQRITAPFRRTLPALRIASKWLVANIKYVLNAVGPPVGAQLSPTGRGTREVLIEGLPLFWAKFAQFYSALSAIFPSARLPPLTTPLDEDIDLKGFLPLRDLLVDEGTLADASGHETEGQQNGTASHGREKVHPNEEQLMRIWDLLKDARTLAKLEICPIHLDVNTFSFDDGFSAVSFADIHESVVHVPDQIIPYVSQGTSGRENDPEDDAMTDTSRTDDDPVGDAFREALDGHGPVDDEDDGEVILWNPRALGSPPAPVPAVLPTTPLQRSATKVDESPPLTTTPGRRAPKSPVIVPGTTAQDLLNNVMGTKRGSIDVLRPQRPATSSSIQPQFPFPLGPNAPPSIWSTSLDHSQPSPHFQSSQTISAIGPGHRESLSLSLGTPQHIPQPPFQASHTLSSPMTHFTEHRQSQWQKSNSVSFIDPAIVSAATISQTTTHYGVPTSYQGFSDSHTQQYNRSGQHHKSPTRAWGVHG